MPNTALSAFPKANTWLPSSLMARVNVCPQDTCRRFVPLVLPLAADNTHPHYSHTTPSLLTHHTLLLTHHTLTTHTTYPSLLTHHSHHTPSPLTIHLYYSHTTHTPLTHYTYTTHTLHTLTTHTTHPHHSQHTFTNHTTYSHYSHTTHPHYSHHTLLTHPILTSSHSVCSSESRNRVICVT